MDRGAPHWVFGASVVFMLLTVAFALIGDGARPIAVVCWLRQLYRHRDKAFSEFA
jgi:hypothetical protein